MCQELYFIYVFDFHESMEGVIIIIPDLCLRKLRGKIMKLPKFVQVLSIRSVSELTQHGSRGPCLNHFPYACSVRKRNWRNDSVYLYRVCTYTPSWAPGHSPIKTHDESFTFILIFIKEQEGDYALPLRNMSTVVAMSRWLNLIHVTAVITLKITYYCILLHVLQTLCWPFYYIIEGLGWKPLSPYL